MIHLQQRALDTLMPMHLVINAEGQIVATGPTMAKIIPDAIGAAFFDIFTVRRPARLSSVADLASREGDPLKLTLCQDNDTNLRGTVVRATSGDLLMNLSFGIGVIDAVGRFSLTDKNFASTDLTVELLYLVEAKSAVMEELRRLNFRLEGAKVKAEEQALTDTLTGLRNRRALEAALRGLIDSGMPFGLMQIDLDYFKAVNDTLGHAAGDHVLRNVSVILRRETRAADFIARVGGDEFILLLPGLVGQTTLSKVANRIISGLEEPVDFEGAPCRISGSIGLTSTAEYPNAIADQMLEDVDAATYASKHAGRGRATFRNQQLTAANA